MFKKLLSTCLLMPTLVMASGDLCDPKTSTIGDCVMEINKRIKQLEEENQAQQEEIQALKTRLSLTDGLVAYYPFNGNANDVSGNENHGTVKGATLTKDRFGKSKSAYRFDGDNDCILANDTNSLDIQNSISLLAWLKTDGLHKVGYGMIVAKHFTHDARAYALYDVNDIGSGKGLRLNLCEPNNVCHSLPDKPIDNAWHFVTGTYNKSSETMKLYIDAVLVSENKIGQIDLMQTSIPLSIGCYLDSNDGSKRRAFFHGIIDDIRIYNRALTDVEIQSLYKQR
ncbi:LamG domain-containing protein [Candidatus Parabeggiatoa sp. HSG14]|uniref:LamG domain-containing protein n=1 Tax=Candidatus Parabeggiatoa sp. HSG14 TaxID=3055593 RepID=UPI0025A77773|nr:LamG domain-containing protein [Thiotrichales bacterium HSG14]